ncbi:hypothetical protein [Veillonella montpellierensis]|uniref:hypothetical protein n=1 Tax=Veillonella montpellierensis TaxID=187328 RepID=UPI0023F79BF7|nr:hypothetical protein [Veillonella montpellierensis]
MQSKSNLISNERSVGSELITKINIIFSNNNWGMKKAVGELSLKSENAKDNRNSTLFPDIIIFKDEDKLQPLMGWELKMPDVPIDDSEFISNARDKADRLGTSAFVLWNFQYVSIYIKNKNGEWQDKATHFFYQYSQVLIDRKEVQNNTDIWEKQLEDVLSCLNEELLAEKFVAAPIEFNISNYVNTISDKLAPLIAYNYSNLTDITFRKYVNYWVKNEKAELSIISDINNEKKSYLAFAKNIIIKWINRILFSHLIKRYHTGINNLLIDFSKHENINELSVKYNEEVKKTDFYTILNVGKYETILPQEVVSSINEFNIFLSQTNFSNASMEFTSNILENIVDISKRELMGLYTTPNNLAKLLVHLAIDEGVGEYADLTVGSGTIAKNMIKYISNYNSVDYAHDHVWSSDKYNYPLQIANLAMTSPKSINKKNIVFQSDVFDLNIGNSINIVNPMTGKNEVLEIPKFNYLLSNLPFISSNKRNESDKLKIEKFVSSTSLDRKSDIYQIILLKFKDLLDNNNGKIGVIISNSWFKIQKNYKSFYKTLLEYYEVEYILYSNVGRWFANAEIVSSIVILKNKSQSLDKGTKFVSLNINPRTCKEEMIEELSESILFNSESKLFNLEEYGYDEVNEFINLGLSLEPLFDDVSWILDIKEKLVDLNSIFNSSRGVRTGADKIFITGEKYADDEYTFPILKNLSNVDSYHINITNEYYFYTKDSIDTIKNKGNIDTIKYIKKIENTPVAINRKNKRKNSWYQADQKPQFADFATSINPGKRFFWVMFEEETVVNQRVTAFRLKYEHKDDKNLIHALLNTSVSIFMLMGSGFGRALGATDLTKDGISQSYFLNPDLLSTKSKNIILNSWKKIKEKKVENIDIQLEDFDWIKFNKLVYKEYGLPESIFELSKNNIIKLLNRRLNSKKI